MESRNTELSLYGQMPSSTGHQTSSDILNLQSCGLQEDDFSLLPADINYWNCHLTKLDLSYNTSLKVEGLHQLCFALSSLNFPNKVNTLILRAVVVSELGEEYNKALGNIVRLSSSISVEGSKSKSKGKSKGKSSSSNSFSGSIKGVNITDLDVSENKGLFGQPDVDQVLGQNRPISFMHLTDAINESPHTLESLNMSCTHTHTITHNTHNTLVVNVFVWVSSDSLFCLCVALSVYLYFLSCPHRLLSHNPSCTLTTPLLQPSL